MGVIVNNRNQKKYHRSNIKSYTMSVLGLLNPPRNRKGRTYLGQLFFCYSPAPESPRLPFLVRNGDTSK